MRYNLNRTLKTSLVEYALVNKIFSTKKILCSHKARARKSRWNFSGKHSWNAKYFSPQAYKIDIHARRRHFIMNLTFRSKQYYSNLSAYTSEQPQYNARIAITHTRESDRKRSAHSMKVSRARASLNNAQKERYTRATSDAHTLISRRKILRRERAARRQLLRKTAINW